MDSAHGCRQYLWLAERAARQQGRWNSSSQKDTQGFLRAGDGNQVWNQAQPCRDPLTILKVVDKPSHSHSSFPHCSELSPFICPVWYSFKTGFLVFQSLLVMSAKYSIRRHPGQMLPKTVLSFRSSSISIQPDAVLNLLKKSTFLAQIYFWVWWAVAEWK